MVGQIIQKLKQYKLWDDAYILWTSDHGDQLGDHNLWRKTFPYNSNAKVPMIIKWNNAIDIGSVDTVHPVELRDIVPTLHSAAGIELPSNWSTEWSGLDMNRIIKGDDTFWREWIDLEHSTCYNVTNHWNALTDGVHWKYIFNAYFGSEMLFDLENDPDEMNDLAADPYGNVSEVLREWRGRMVTMFEKQGRGHKWVHNGTLWRRKRSQRHGDNYPGNAAPCQ